MVAVYPRLGVISELAGRRLVRDLRCCSSVVERVLGKDEVVGSTPTSSFVEMCLKNGSQG